VKWKNISVVLTSQRCMCWGNS